jgi:hypothetical protein
VAFSVRRRLMLERKCAPMIKGAFILFTAGLPLLFPQSAVRAADLTDVVDAADDGDPFDLHIEPKFKQVLKRSIIRREYPCDPNVGQDGVARFPRIEVDCSEPSVVFRKEVETEREINSLEFDVQIGIFKDVELNLNLPIIFSDQRRLKYADADADRGVEPVTPDTSSVDPSDENIVLDIERNGSSDLSRQSFTRFRYFSLAGEGNLGVERKGFGDMSLGIAWNPFNQERDDTKSTLKLGFDYTIPTGEIAKPGNEGVGRGMHELKWTIAASKRFKYLEPYFGVSYVLPIASDKSLFQKDGLGQTLLEPGQRAEVTFGSEFIPYENLKSGQRFVIDLGVHYAYTAEGRDYNPFFDALNSSECNGLTPREIRDAIEAIRDPNRNADRATINTAACRWILDQPGNAEGGAVFDPNVDDVSDIGFSHDGILDYEAFATFGTHLRLSFEPSPYVRFGALLKVEHEEEHFISAARTGIDSESDEDPTVRFDDPNERNPHHNPNVDAVGNRFRLEDSFNFTWAINLAIQF